MKPEVLIIGDGILGSELIDIFDDASQVTAHQITREDLDIAKTPLMGMKSTIFETMTSLDYRESVMGWGYKFVSGGCIINAAAYTDVDLAEHDKDLAFQTNAAAVYKLALICKEFGIKLIHISTDFVFNGIHPHINPYTEYDDVHPLNWYGKTKLIAENMIKNSGCDYIIVRTGWLYNDEKGFVHKIAEMVRTKKNIEGIEDQILTPTHSRDLAKQILVMHEMNLSGLFHATSQGSVKPYELVEYINERINGQKREVERTNRFHLFYKCAQRPAMCVLDNFNLKALGLDMMPPWQESLDKTLNLIKCRGNEKKV